MKLAKKSAYIRCIRVICGLFCRKLNDLVRRVACQPVFLYYDGAGFGACEMQKTQRQVGSFEMADALKRLRCLHYGFAYPPPNIFAALV